MSGNPVVSVLIPAYNSEPYIAAAIESVLNQTFTDFELIVHDDGSTDRTFEIVESYAREYDCIRIDSHKNKGVARTRNLLAECANGKFIAIMDADDVAISSRLSHQVDFLLKNPDCVCVGGAFDLIDERGRYLTTVQPPEDDKSIQDLMLAGHTSINHPCALIRRKSFMEVGGYTEVLSTVGDLDLFLRLGEVGKLANLEQTVLRYRLRSTSISEKKQQEQISDKQYACEQAWCRRGIEGRFEATEPWRPGKDRASQHRFMLKYGWWAFNSGQRHTAMIYGMKAIIALPLSINGWKLLACAIFKKLPDRIHRQHKEVCSS